MSEFKFACPNCQQNIKATSEYSGYQINCPSCQTALVVPPAPDAPAAPASAPSGGPKLSIAASTPHEQPPAPPAAAVPAKGRPTKKKKPKVALYAGIGAGVAAFVALIIFWPNLMNKVSHENKEIAAEQAATNAAPPPPPELTTEEILQKVGETYKGLTDYAAKGLVAGSLNLTALGQKEVRTSGDTTLQLGRTNLFRLEWEIRGFGPTLEGAVWNSGKGNFVKSGQAAPTKVKTRELALGASLAQFVLSSEIAEIFFADTNSFAEQAKDFTKTNTPSPTGKPCYTLTGEVNHLGALLWIDKSSFLVVQIEIIFTGKIDEAEVKKLPSDQRAQVQFLSKIKGNIIETYSNIQTNQNLVASSFETAFKPAGSQTAVRKTRPAPTAGSMTQPRRPRGAAPPPP